MTEKGGLRLEAGDGDGHEADEEDDEGHESGETAGRVEGDGVVDRTDAEELLSQEESSPNVPNKPDAAEGNQGERNEDAGDAVKTGLDGAEDMTAVELRCGQKIHRSDEKADPSGTTDGGEQEEVGIDAGVKEGVEKAKKQGDAEN